MTKEAYMRIALDEARKGWGQTGTNPMVGAVIVEAGQIVSYGYHARFGGPHAEIEALKNLGRKPASDAVFYVTLEPCSSTGKTGPCTQAIIESGIRKVVVGTIDPDQRHQGRGIALLKSEGIRTEVGVLEGACEDLNLIFNFHAKNDRPLFAAKTATTLDGKTSTRSGNSQWITGEEARRDVMQWRRYFPAIAVGSGTALADNPSLTSRLEGSIDCGIRFIFDRRLRTIEQLDTLQVYNDAFKSNTILVCGDNADVPPVLKSKGIRFWKLPLEKALFWKRFSEKCHEASIQGVYFEGGPGLLSDLLGHRQLDYLFAYRAPKFLADSNAPEFIQGQKVDQMSDAYVLENVQHGTFGNDQLTRGFIHYT